MSSQIDDTEFVNVLLTSLPDLWKTFITAIQGASVLLDSHIMIGCILKEDCWWRSQLGTSNTALQACSNRSACVGSVKYPKLLLRSDS
jgi:hypothetical protein